MSQSFNNRLDRLESVAAFDTAIANGHAQARPQTP